MDKATLNELIERSKANDQKSFRIIVEAHQSMIYSLAFRMMCNEEEAKDIVQETFIKVWLNLSRFNQDKKFSTWLFSITAHLCLDRLKSWKRHFQIEFLETKLHDIATTEDADQCLMNNELGELILALTNDLTPKQRLVFTLRDLEEIDVAEVEEITGLSAKKIKSNLFLARQNIRQKLERY